MFFCSAAFYMLDRYLEPGGTSWPLAAGFSVCVILGCLSQLTFVSFYLATLAWSLYRVKGDVKGMGVRTILCCHLAPLLFLAAFYFVDIRHITGIGGTPSSLLQACASVPAWAIGSPANATAQVVASILAVAILWREYGCCDAIGPICACSFSPRSLCFRCC